MKQRRHLIHALGVVACATLFARTAGAQGIPPLVFHAELGGGAVLTAPQQRQLGLLGAFEGTLRAGVRFHPAVSARLSGSYWGYPARSDNGASQMYGAASVQAGVRIDPAIGTRGRLWLDLDFGVGFTGANPVRARPAGGVGVGFDFTLASTFAMGPFARVEVLVPISGNDQLAAPITLVGGVAFTYEWSRRPPPAPAPTLLAPTLPAPVTPPPPAPADPDPDRDGILGAADRCPNEPETRNAYEDDDGCPDNPDADGDGVLLPTDRCPNEPETRNAYEDDDGCPDNPDADNDGVLLPADRCPDQPETRNEFEDTDGCPDTPPPVVLAGERITVNGTILFQTDRDRILPESFGLLDQVAAILQGHSEIRRIRIEGHTDNQGRPRRNRDLSRHRAEAVERYLRDHGIDRDRLTSEGYGADRRIAMGDTPEDHARNRRVEFYIVDPPGGVSATAAAAAAPPAAPAPDEERGRHRRHRREGGRRHHRRH
jgi:outer membrane protein OmpA-like peptidoglycan-associated protein